MDTKEFKCEDGHTVSMRSTDENELIRALQYHSETYHSKSISEDEARVYIKDISE